MRLLLILFTAFLTAALVAPDADAQILKRAKKRAKDRVERKVDRKVDQAVDKSVDEAEEAVEDAILGDDDQEADAQGAPHVRSGDAAGAAGQAGEAGAGNVAEPGGGDVASLAPGQGAWANYDFIPGNRVLFYDDFEGDYVGDFPRRLEFMEGAMEIVEWEGRRLLRVSGTGGFKLVLPETLPDRFTLEVEFYSENIYNDIKISPDLGLHWNEYRRDNNWIQISNYFETGIAKHGNTRPPAAHMRSPALSETVTPVRVMADGKYMKVFVNEQRVANVPNALFQRSDALIFATRIHVRGEPMYIGTIRLAAGGREILYDRLVADGRVTTQGIYFDTGSARLRPESTPTLREVGRMLQKHGDLRLTIEGHTDNTGSVETNERLSQERAEAVRAFLIDEYQIEAARLNARGFGPHQPVADNGTKEGQQMNRRVDLVKT